MSGAGADGPGAPPVTPVRQTDFTATRGNALQACVAAVLGQPLAAVPNFLASPLGYLPALQAWLAPRRLAVVKVPLTAAGCLPDALPAGTPVLLRGTRPRGAPAHVGVGRVAADGVRVAPAMDPHPDDTMLDGPGQWAAVFVALDPRAVAAAQAVHPAQTAEQPPALNGLF